VKRKLNIFSTEQFTFCEHMCKQIDMLITHVDKFLLFA